MQTTSLQLYSLNYSQAKTYLFAVVFAVGNIILPQVCHLVPQGGLMLLPIYFFTLIGAYKYGWKVGIITAILSPVVNHLAFGMPPLAVLPVILSKSILLAFAAGLAANHFKRISIPVLVLVVLVYQTVGTLLEWAMIGDFLKAIQDFRIGIPGMLIQIVGAYLVLKYLIRK
jgi:hypothetical protein